MMERKQFGHLCRIRCQNLVFVINCTTLKLINPMHQNFSRSQLSSVISDRLEVKRIKAELEDDIGELDYYKEAQVIRIPYFELPIVAVEDFVTCLMCTDFVSTLERRFHDHAGAKHKGNRSYLNKVKGYSVATERNNRTYFLLVDRPDPFATDVENGIESELVDEYLAGIGDFELFLDELNSHLYPVKGPEYSAFKVKLKDYFLKDRPHISRSGKYGHHFIVKQLMVVANAVTLANYASAALEFTWILMKIIHEEDVDLFMETSLPNLLALEDTVHILKKALYCSFVDGRKPKNSKSRAWIFDGVKALMKLCLMDSYAAADIIVGPDDLKLSAYEMMMLEYATHLRYHNTLPLQFIKELGDGKISIDGTLFSLEQCRQMVTGLCKEYRKKLKAIFDFEPFTDVDQHYSKVQKFLPGNATKSESVLFGKDSAHLSHEAHAVFDQFKIKLGLNDPDQETRAGIWRTLKSLHELNLTIFVAIMFSCGSPYRVSELLTLRFRSTLDFQRNLLFMDETILQITHNKNNTKTQKYDCFPKSIPAEVNRIVVHYLSLVRRIEYYLALEYTNNFTLSEIDTEPDANLEAIEEEDPRTCYREVIANDFKFQPNKYKHALMYYVFAGPGDIRNGSHIFRYMKSISNQIIGCQYVPRMVRHALTYLTQVHVKDFFEKYDKSVLTDLSAGHSVHTATTQYVVNKYAGRNALVEYLQLEVSHAWHRCLGLRSDYFQNTSGKKNLDHLEEIMRANVAYSPTIMNKTGAVLHGDNFQKYDEDRMTGLLTIYLNSMNVLFVAPSGSGKTDLIMVPPMIESSKSLPFVTVLIAPSISFKDNMLHRLSQNLETKIFDPKESSSEYSTTEIIILQPENAYDFRKIMSFYDCDPSPRKIRRVVFYECHILLHDPIYRRRMKSLIEMFGDQYPKVFLTATLPETHEKDLIESFDIRSNNFTIRTLTVKKNVRYHVNVCEKPWEKAAEIYNQIKEKGKCLVYSYSEDKENIESFCGTFGCSFFHGGLTSTAKANLYKEFIEEKDVMVCTNAFPHGVDISGISSIIVVGENPNIIDFVQIVGSTYRGEPKKVADVFLLDASPNRHCVKYDECINSQISRQMNGKYLNCFELKSEVCDVCSGDNSMVLATGESRKRKGNRIKKIKPLKGVLGKFLSVFDATHYGIQLHELKCKGCGLDKNEQTTHAAEHHVGGQCKMRPHLGILVIEGLKTGSEEFIKELEEEGSLLDIMRELSHNSSLVHTFLKSMKKPELPRSFLQMGRPRKEFYQLVCSMFPTIYERMQQEQSRSPFHMGTESIQKFEEVITIWKDAASKKNQICSECSMQVHDICLGDITVRALLLAFRTQSMFKQIFPVEIYDIYHLFCYVTKSPEKPGYQNFMEHFVDFMMQEYGRPALDHSAVTMSTQVETPIQNNDEFERSNIIERFTEDLTSRRLLPLSPDLGSNKRRRVEEDVEEINQFW